MELTQDEINEMRRVKAYFPFRKVSGVKDPDGTFSVYANATYAKANNHAKKTGGRVWRFE